MIELEQDLSGGSLAAEGLQRTNPLRSTVNYEGLDSWIAELHRHCAVVVGNDPLPIGIGLGQQALVDLEEERWTLGILIGKDS